MLLDTEGFRFQVSGFRFQVSGVSAATAAEAASLIAKETEVSYVVVAVLNIETYENSFAVS